MSRTRRHPQTGAGVACGQLNPDRLDLLTGARLTAKDLATELGKTARTISTDLRFLRENKFIRVVDENEGIYTASDNV